LTARHHQAVNALTMQRYAQIHNVCEIISRLSEDAIDGACLRGVEPPAPFDPVILAQMARNCALDMTLQIYWSSVTYWLWILPRWSISAILL
jgi:hypothetical protein